MDLWEAKEIAQMGWPENQKAQRQHDAVDWLIAEVERLTELAQLDEIGAANLMGIEEYLHNQKLLAAERDKYKAALERIASGTTGTEPFPYRNISRDDMKAIAEKALAP